MCTLGVNCVLFMTKSADVPMRQGSQDFLKSSKSAAREETAV
jgi:hypothetical protein